MKSVFRRLVDFDKALVLLSENLPLIRETEMVNLKDAVGRVAAVDILSGRDNPPFHRATMDGFAVKSSDIEGATTAEPVELSVEGEAYIGEPQKRLRAGKSCIRISTGSVIPLGSDCVVPIEDCEDHSSSVRVKISLDRGKNVAEAGSDLPSGSLALSAFNVIDAGEVALLASIGLSRIRVFRKIRIAIFSTGNELISPGRKYRNGMIYDSNSHMIAAELSRYPVFKIDNLGIIKDRKDLLDQILKDKRSSYDVIILSGGSSAGNFDLVYGAIGDQDPGIIFHGVLIKPGLPTVFGRTGNTVIIGLPGFPVSSYVVMKTIYLDSLLRMAVSTPIHRTESMKIAARLDLEIGKRNIIPVRTERIGGKAYPVPGLSGSISRLIDTDGYVSVPGALKFIEAGEVQIIHAWDSGATTPDPRITGNIDELNLDSLRKLCPEGGLALRPDNEAIHSVSEGITDAAVIRAQEILGLKLELESMHGSAFRFLESYQISRHCLIPKLADVEIPISGINAMVEEGSTVDGPSLGLLRKISVRDEAVNLFYSSMRRSAASYNTKFHGNRKVIVSIADGKGCTSTKHPHFLDIILSRSKSEIVDKITSLGYRRI